MLDFLPHINDVHAFCGLEPETCMWKNMNSLATNGWKIKCNEPWSRLKQYFIPVKLCVALYVDDGSGVFWWIGIASNKHNEL